MYAVPREGGNSATKRCRLEGKGDYAGEWKSGNWAGFWVEGLHSEKIISKTLSLSKGKMFFFWGIPFSSIFWTGFFPLSPLFFSKIKKGVLFKPLSFEQLFYKTVAHPTFNLFHKKSD